MRGPLGLGLANHELGFGCQRPAGIVREELSEPLQSLVNFARFQVLNRGIKIRLLAHRKRYSRCSRGCREARNWRFWHFTAQERRVAKSADIAALKLNQAEL